MRTPRTVVRCGVLLAIFLGVVLLPSDAVADRAFGPRFTVNTQGDIAIAGNMLMSCLGTDPVCPAARAGMGSALNNNNRVITYVDVDGSAATFNSSDATLNIPTGAPVLFAGLYYGGKVAAGTGGVSGNPALRGTVLLRAPGDEDYRTLTASQIDTASDLYQGFVDVTAIVSQTGAGSYRVANVQLGTGKSSGGQVGGWSMVVVYGDSTAPSRNLTVFDGFRFVGQGQTLTIPLSGFRTPLSGEVRSVIGIVAYEGDLGSTGDVARLNGVVLSNAVNPANNTFNSTVSSGGAIAADRNPDYPNTLGFDADLLTAPPGALGNDQTSADIGLTTTLDVYAPGVVTIATDLYAPKIVPMKSVDLATADLGDELTYTVGMENTGQDGADNFVLSDPIPANTSYVPESLEVLTGPNAGPKTDAPGDDQAEFDAAGNRVVMRLGVGANATTGGLLAPGAASTVRFRVRVNATGVPFGASIENHARATFTAQTTEVADGIDTPPAETAVRVPEIQVRKIHDPPYVPGQASTVLIAVGNHGDGTTTGRVTVQDTLPPELTITSPPFGTDWTCTVAGQQVTCTYDLPIAPQESPFAIVVPVLVSPDADVGDLCNTATVTLPEDGDPTNNSWEDCGAVTVPAFDLAVTKEVDNSLPYGPRGSGVRDTIEYTIRVTNGGPDPATNVQLADTLPVPMEVESITPSQGSCSGTTCNLGTIEPEGEATVTLIAFMPNNADNYPGDATLTNQVTVSSAAGEEQNPDDNTATAGIQTFPLADVAIDKSFAPAAPLAGGPVTYTLVVSSKRQTADATMFDVIPPQILNPQVSISGGSGLCELDLAGELFGLPGVFCAIPQFETGSERIVTVTGTLALDSGGTAVNNIAAITSDALQRSDELADNVDQASFVPGMVDLTLAKSRLEDGTLPVGAETTFRLVVGNQGTASASGVVVTDPLPDGLTLVSAPGCTSSGQTVTCEAGTLAPGAEQTFDLRVRAEVAVAERTLTNLATVAGSDPDVVPGNNSGSVDVTIGPFSTLSVTKTASATSVTAGSPITFTVVVQNSGPSAAGTVSLTDVLPAGLTLRSVTPSQGSCTGATCSLGDLPAGSTAQVVIVVDTDASATGKRLVNSVEVTATTPSSPARAEAPVDVTAPPAAPTPRVDVAVDVRGPTAVVREGGVAAFRINVTNGGPATATSVVLTGTANRAVSDSYARLLQNCTGLPLHCELGTMAPGAQRSFTVRVRNLQLGRVTLAGTVTAAETETTLTNNVDRASIRIRAGRAVVRFTKRAGTATAQSGGVVGFTIAIRNTGSVPARSVVVCDRLPSGLVWERLDGARLVGGRACWTLRRLAGGSTARYRISTRATSVARVRRVTNTAIVRGTNLARRTAGARVTVRPAATPRPPFTG